MRRLVLAGLLGLTSAALGTSAGCAGRDERFTRLVKDTYSVGLDRSLVLVDGQLNRAIVLEPTADGELRRTEFAVGSNVARVEASPDGKRAFVISAGAQPRKSERDERPSLTVFERLATGYVATPVPLATPLSGISVDPEGRWAVLYAGSSSAGRSFVENPNELVLLDLTKPVSATNPVSRTIRSFGGRPVRVSFSPSLTLPEGKRRLLVVESEQDITLLDLDHVSDTPPRPEITVRLTSGADTRKVAPAAVVFDDGDPAKADDARLGVRLLDDSSVLTLRLGAPDRAEAGGNDFFPRINLTEVGGSASDLAFVKTDGGLRLAALVPSRSMAVLVDPDTSLTTNVALPEPYQRLSLITDVVGAGSPSTAGVTDSALLYASSNARGGVGFWSLGKTSGAPYRSVEVLALDGSANVVLDVPKPHAELKVVSTSASTFYVLDLLTRTASPLLTPTKSNVKLMVSRTGETLFAFAPNGPDVAGIELTKKTYRPIPLVADANITAVFDVAREGGGRTLMTLHQAGGWAVTLFDADRLQSPSPRLISGLMLEGL